jgi:hypothetical protein
VELYILLFMFVHSSEIVRSLYKWILAEGTTTYRIRHIFLLLCLYPLLEIVFLWEYGL